MNGKPLKILTLLGVTFLLVLTASIATARSSQLPKYVGSQACLGCHSDKYSSWSESTHAVSMRQLISPEDYPGDPAAVPAELKAELEKADFLWHDRRFLAQDPATGELKYLNIQWNRDTKQYESYKGGGVWSASCGGCHSGTVNTGTHYARNEAGIGCENCHGPGLEHIQGKGDLSKIVKTADPSAVCAQCHSGNNTLPDSTRFAKGYVPGTKIEEFPTFKAAVFDPSQPPPVKDGHHLQEYPQWKASGHANATNLLAEHGPSYTARPECIKCHSTSAGLQIAKGETFNPATDLIYDGVSCMACHDTHGKTENEFALKMDAQALCVSCHSVGRGNPAPVTIGTKRAPHSPQADMVAGTSAIGIPATEGPHTGVECIQCHMTEGNHMMKVIKPEDTLGTERVDTCTKCHTGSSAESRYAYLDAWQTSITRKVDGLAADVALIEAALKADANALTGDNLTLFQNARANFWYVQKDNSKGAHNFEYATKILSQTQKDMQTVKAALPK